MKTVAIIVTFLLTLGVVNRSFGGMILAENGQTAYCIVLDESALPAEKLAAEELQEYLGQVTGAKFDIVLPSSADAENRPRIFVGPSEASNKLAPKIAFDRLAGDEIVIKTVGRDLLLSGGRPRGTIFAVYTFLQETVGCRWWTEDSETIPSKPTLQIENLNVTYRPQFEFRCLSSEYVTRRPFAYKLRLNWVDMTFDPSCTSILAKLLPGEKYFLERPDWYMFTPEGGEGDGDGEYEYPNMLKIVEETRSREMYETAKKTRRLPWQPCLTSQGAIATISEGVVKELEADYANWTYEPKVVWVTQQDGSQMCHCEKCAAVRKVEGSDSALWVNLANHVGERIEKQYPDVLVGIHAYLHTLQPPKTVKPRKNVLIYMAVLDNNHGVPLNQLEEEGSALRKWTRISSNVWMWDYIANFRNYLIPHPNHFVMGESLRFYHREGVKGALIQGSFGTCSELIQMRGWVVSQQLWNPDQNDAELMKEFLEGYYGPAAPMLMKYVEIQTQAASRKKDFFLSCYAGSTDGWLTLQDLNAMTRTFDEAEQVLADDPALLERVRRARFGVDVTWLERYAELKEEARKTGGEFLGPQNPRAAVEELARDELHVGQYRERIEFPEYVEQLRKQFQPGG